MNNKKIKSLKFINEIKRVFNKDINNKFNQIQLNLKETYKSIVTDYQINLIKYYKNTKLKIFNSEEGLTEKFENAVDKLIKKDNSEVVLSSSVVWARSILFTLIGGTAFGIGWLALAKTDEIIVSQGKLEPISGVVEIQMPIQGIAKEIYVQEGQNVEIGEILIQLDPQINANKLETLMSTLRINVDIQRRLKILVEEGAVSQLQYLDQTNKVLEIENQIKENEIISKYQSISAPIDGKIFDLKAVKPGFVGNTSEPIMKIVPIDNLRAKIEIESRKIGFVSINKPVDISIDSFPATDFGTISGKISSISSDALKPDPQIGKGYRFPANITLDSQSIELKNGNKLPLQSGMSITANIKLRKVSYLQLLLGTFREKAGSLKEI